MIKQIDALSEEQVQQLGDLFQEEWWTKGRNLPDIRLAVQNSSIVVGFCDTETGELVAFARVLTDFVYKAQVFDVMVKSTRRGCGLGRRLMDSLVHHPRLAAVRHLELYTQPDTVDFYAKWGFASQQGKRLYLRLSR